MVKLKPANRFLMSMRFAYPLETTIPFCTANQYLYKYFITFSFELPLWNTGYQVEYISVSNLIVGMVIRLRYHGRVDDIHGWFYSFYGK
jgi:hypothetical protein